jgi:hypothetical protein
MVMRGILLLIFGGLVFSLILVLVQAILALDNTQMRWFFLPLVGRQSGERYAPGFTVEDILAYLIAAIVTGMVVYRFSRLFYRRNT